MRYLPGIGKIPGISGRLSAKTSPRHRNNTCVFQGKKFLSHLVPSYQEETQDLRITPRLTKNCGYASTMFLHLLMTLFSTDFTHISLVNWSSSHPKRQVQRHHTQNNYFQSTNLGLNHEVLLNVITMRISRMSCM